MRTIRFSSSVVGSLLLINFACVGDDPAVSAQSGAPSLDAGVDGAQEPSVAETACDPKEAVKPGVFASPGGDDVTGDGTPAAPFKTISRALASAKAGGSANVYLDVGAYAEQVDVPAFTVPVTVSGAWRATGSTWSRACDTGRRGLTVVRSPTTVGARIVQGGAGLTVQDLTILTRTTAPPTQAGTPAETAYGIFAKGSGAEITLRNVEVRAGDGGDGGQPAAPKTKPTPASCTCKAAGGVGATGLDGADGADTASSAKTPGVFIGDGFVPPAGVDGSSPGIDGENGGPPGSVTPDARCGFTDCASACSCAKTTNVATPDCVNFVARTNQPGACGCGGLGGDPGGGGGGGGASIAVFLSGTGARLTLDHVLLATGNGGVGAPAAAGAPGGAPTGGKEGPPLDCYPNRYCWNMGPGCTNVDVPGAKVTHTAQAGGNGGKGGRGQGGGAGAGGTVAGIVLFGGATASETEVGIALKHPGAGGGSGAAAGDAKERLTAGL